MQSKQNDNMSITNFAYIFRRFMKSKYLRVVNLIGLSLVFACMILSYIHVKQELSYDRFNVNASRIARLSLQFDDEQVDGRIYGFNVSRFLSQFPEIEKITPITKVNTVLLTYNGKPQVVNDIYFASSNFFETFSYNLSQGQKEKVLDSPDKVVISESYARHLFGNESPIGKEMHFEGRKIEPVDVFVSGVFKDFPKNSHFHTDILMHRPDDDMNDWPYVYLLLNQSVDLGGLEQKISNYYNKNISAKDVKTIAKLTPLTDIHLHSRVLREMEPNGNIYFIYLIIGSNILLFSIVLFNLWLNEGVIFLYNRRHYQILKFNGASSSSILKIETILAFIMGIFSILIGVLFSWYGASLLHYSLLSLSLGEILVLCAVFLLTVIFVSLLPVMVKFSFSKVKYMLIGQYAIVMFVIILTVGISKQVNYIKSTQVGGKDSSILVMPEQPEQVKLRYKVLKAELEKHPEIKGVTAAMQLPGSAIRDMVGAKTEEQNEYKKIPVLVVSEDFLPFFNVKPIAGQIFSRDIMTSEEQYKMFMMMMSRGEKYSNEVSEEYVLNDKALSLLNIGSPEKAVGKILTINHGALGYINKGRICGVVGNFTYTTMYEDTIPMIIMQRPLYFFLNCFMIHLDKDNIKKSMDVFKMAWDKVNPDYPPAYSFLQDEYGKVYRNELNAELLIRIFSILCLIIANLGLVVFTAFIIKHRFKEIGIRKINGATSLEIVKLLNIDFICWITMAFVIAVPIAFFVMQKWLEDFAHKTSLGWWLYIVTGLSVLSLSLVSVSWMTWRAATTNPIDAVKAEN